MWIVAQAAHRSSRDRPGVVDQFQGAQRVVEGAQNALLGRKGLVTPGELAGSPRRVLLHRVQGIASPNQSPPRLGQLVAARLARVAPPYRRQPRGFGRLGVGEAKGDAQASLARRPAPPSRVGRQLGQ